MTEKLPIKTKDIAPRKGEMIKPVEIIGLGGMAGWTLADRRTWNILLANAWGDRLEDPTADFTIPLRELRGLHDSNDRVRESLRRLQTTLVDAVIPNGATRTVQMLGGTDISDSDREDGVLKYDFHRKLVPLLRDSDVYARLETKILSAMTSKFSLALYEILAARVNLYKQSEIIDLPTLRSWLGVESGKLSTWSDLRRKAVEIAVNEVNTLAPFTVDIAPVSRGRKIEKVKVSWAKKQPFSTDERAAVLEVNRHKAGRKARNAGTVETVINPRLYLAPKTLQSIADQTEKAGCRLDMAKMHEQWLSERQADNWIPENPAGHFQSFCMSEVKRQLR